MKHYLRFFIMASLILACSVLLIACNEQNEVSDNEKTTYDIERVFPDDIFINIIEGKTVPIETVVGFGGENGYEQFSTKDSAMIDEYIKAFRAVNIAEEIDDEEKMIFVADGIIDYTFLMEDGTKVTLGTDLNVFVTDRERGIQFHLDNTDQLNALNKRIRE